jgi:two-component system CheB/CheR fusion protein
MTRFRLQSFQLARMLTIASLHDRTPIDSFLATLAADQNDYAVGILLSGSGTDGTLGIKAIKEQGGLTLAQTTDHSGRSDRGSPKRQGG